MDEKTEELRDIFLDVSDEETVTESQTETRGSLVDQGESVEERLQAVIQQLRDKIDTRETLDEGDAATLVRGFYAGSSDDELATELDSSNETVFDARMELHLVRDEDVPALEQESAIRDALQAGEEPAAVASEYDASEETIGQFAAVLEAENRSRRVSHRYRTAYEEILTDADLTVQFAADAHADGLEEATEGAETDVEF